MNTPPPDAQDYFKRRPVAVPDRIHAVHDREDNRDRDGEKEKLCLPSIHRLDDSIWTVLLDVT